MKRHSLDLTSLVFGLVFLVYASLWPLWRLGILDRNNSSWLPASALILIGLLGVTLSIARSRPNRSDQESRRDERKDLDAQTHMAFDDEPTAVVVDEPR